MGKLLIVMIFFGFVFSTCNRNDEEYCTEKNTLKLNQHIMNYFHFKPGSWWIYEEESSGKKDSIWVEYYKDRTWNPVNQKKYCRCGRGKCVQRLELNFVNFTHNSNFNDDLYGYVLDGSVADGSSIVYETGRAYFSSSTYRLEYTKEGNPISPTSLGGIVENLPSLHVKGKEFNEIMHIYYPKEGVGDWLQEAWYAKNISLVKFRLNDSTTWNLIKYNIVK